MLFLSRHINCAFPPSERGKHRLTWLGLGTERERGLHGIHKVRLSTKVACILTAGTTCPGNVGLVASMGLGNHQVSRSCGAGKIHQGFSNTSGKCVFWLASVPLYRRVRGVVWNPVVCLGPRGVLYRVRRR